MNPGHAELWQRVEEFAFDDPSARLPFSARLAKDNGWSGAYAQRVIEEYRRFAFLAIAAGHPVSPSDAVDQAWHEHLTYTRSYWDEFCGKVLRRPLHHEPTRGGAAEGAKFADWYARTLASYRTFFGSEPPPDIWPAPERRAQIPERFVRVNAFDNWVVRKPRLHRGGRWLAVAVPMLAVAGCGSVAVMATLGPLDWKGPDFLRFFGGFAVAMFAVAAGARWWLCGGPVRLSSVDTSDPYAIAALAGGPRRALDVALGRLWERGMLRADLARRVLNAEGELPANTPEVERRIFYAAAEVGGASHVKLVQTAEVALEPTMGKLRQEGLLLEKHQMARAHLVGLLLALSVPLLGFIKILIGLSRNRPVSILVVLSLVALGLAIALFRRRPLRTRAGDAALRRLSSSYSHLNRTTPLRSTAPEFPLAVALFGATVLPASLLAMWQQTMPRRALNSSGSDGGSSISSCSSSSSDSGGGGSSCGGGGSSGCGGCGGGGGGGGD